jgi:hypothetical protein
LKVLPPQTRTPASPTTRRHQPRLASAPGAYRPCLRWDFGFTCALCLLHEADLYGSQAGGEGTAGFGVEHPTLRSEDPARANDYANCLYACRFCNTSRDAKPSQEGGARLLDPSLDAWGDHFVAAGDRLVPIPGDEDAAYTHRAYEIDDPRKVVRRALRRELITDRLLLVEGQADILELLRLLDLVRRTDLPSFALYLERLAALRSETFRALGDLERYAAIPADAPGRCHCSAPGGTYSLPEELERQLIEVPDGTGQ